MNKQMNKKGKGNSGTMWIVVIILIYLGLGLWYHSLHQLANYSGTGTTSLLPDLLTGPIKLISNGFRY